MATTTERTPVRFADPPVQPSPQSARSTKPSTFVPHHPAMTPLHSSRPASAASVYYSPSSTPRPVHASPQASLAATPRSTTKTTPLSLNASHVMAMMTPRKLRFKSTPSQPSLSILYQRLFANTFVFFILFCYGSDIAFLLRIIALKPLKSLLPFHAERYIDTAISGCLFILAYNAILAIYGLATYSPEPVEMEKLSDVVKQEIAKSPKKEARSKMAKSYLNLSCVVSPQKSLSTSSSRITTPLSS